MNGRLVEDGGRWWRVVEVTEHPPPPSEPAGPPAPGESSGAADPDVHFPGRPSFRVALEQLGGLDVGPVPGEDPSPDDGRS